jgi:FkbM family methyltransferase
MQKPLIAYGGNLEDVLLFRALRGVERGFYIDVGANDPIEDSVTKLFYDRGWHGINVEPQRRHLSNLLAARARDINLGVAVSDRNGTVVFHEVMGWAHGLSTLRPEALKKHDLRGANVRSYDVQSRTLTDICAEYAPADIHFLKIDVEGAEEDVLRGFDLTKYRPWIIVAEYLGGEPPWDHLIVGQDYKFAHADFANRYYVSNDHTELMQAFLFPVDFYQRYSRKDIEDALLFRHKPLKWMTTQLSKAVRKL